LKNSELEELDKDAAFVRRWRHRLEALPFFGKSIAGVAAAIASLEFIIKPWMEK